MKRVLISLTLFAAIFSGCGEELEDDLVLDEDTQVNEDYNATTNNSGGVETPYGYTGDGLFFGDYEVVKYSWSVYLKRSEYGNYNAYIMGFDMYDTGKLGYQSKTPGYKSNIYEWAVSEYSNELVISPEYRFKIEGRFTADEINCYKISGFKTGEYGKICAEEFINKYKQENENGYFGNDVLLGNYSKGNISPVGIWQRYEIVEGEVQTSPSQTFELLSDGIVEATGELWGVSGDGKSITIGEESFLIYRYLEDNCFTMFNSFLDVQKGEVKLCKIE